MQQTATKKPPVTACRQGTGGRWKEASRSLPISSYHDTGSVAIALTDYERELAAGVGLRRHLAALIDQRPSGKHGEPSAPWERHIEGALAECAVAKALGVYWNGSVNTFKDGGDVGNLQVRMTAYKDGRLIVRSDDRDEDAFILAVGKDGVYTIHGWLFGHEAKQSYWRTSPDTRRPACWCVPQSELRPLEELREVWEW